jgi:hypothetical protein
MARGSSIGGVAQLGERLPCTQEVIGSNPFTSTRWSQELWITFRVMYNC